MTEHSGVTGGLRDYVAWHDAYRDPTSPLSTRLRRVQAAIERVYDEDDQGGGSAPRPIHVLSSCAGQGHDILGVLERRPDLRLRTHGALLELLPENARVAREWIEQLGVDLQVVEGDASISDAYAGHVPADLVLLSGIMGNISTDDIHRLVMTAPQFCREGASVIWTRGAQEPDLGRDISRWFAEAGFVETSYEDRIEGTSMRVGVEKYAGQPVALVEGVRLFTFFR